MGTVMRFQQWWRRPGSNGWAALAEAIELMELERKVDEAFAEFGIHDWPQASARENR